MASRFFNRKDYFDFRVGSFEITTVIRRRYLDGEFTEIDAKDLIAKIMKDSWNYDIVRLSGNNLADKLAEQAFNIPVTMRLRALDGIHLVSAALALDFANKQPKPEPFVFVSSDIQFLRVMQHQGYSVENPEDHP